MISKNDKPILLDTNRFIYYFDKTSKFFKKTRKFFNSRNKHKIQASFEEIVFYEMMKGLEKKLNYTKEQSIKAVREFLKNYSNIWDNVICLPNIKLFNDTLTNYEKSSLTGEDGIFDALFATKVTNNKNDFFLDNEILNDLVSNKKNINSLKQRAVLEPIVIVKLVDDIKESIKDNYKKGTHDKKGKVHDAMKPYLEQIYNFITHNPEKIIVPNALTILAGIAIAYFINIGLPDGTLIAQSHIKNIPILTSDEDCHLVRKASFELRNYGYISKELSEKRGIVEKIEDCLKKYTIKKNQTGFINAMMNLITNKKT